MRIETHLFEEEVGFWVDLDEGETVQALIGALHRAAAEMSTDVYEAQDGDGDWTLFGDGSRASFGLRIESVIEKGVFVTPLYLEADGEDVPLEDVALLLQRAIALLTEPDETAMVISEILAMAPKRRPAVVDPLTGVIDDDGLTVEIILDEQWVVDGEVHTLEGFGGTLRLTPPPRPVGDF